MSYNELLNNIKPYVKNVKSNIEESKNIDLNLKNVEKDIKEYEGLGELGQSELAKANNKKSSLEADKKKLKNKSINELASAKKLIKSERKMYESKVKGYTNALNYREDTIKRCKNQMLKLKEDGKTAKYTATNEYVKKVIEEKKTIARKRTELINEFKEEKPKLDNLESLLVLSKIEELEKEVEKRVAEQNIEEKAEAKSEQNIEEKTEAKSEQNIEEKTEEKEEAKSEPEFNIPPWLAYGPENVKEGENKATPSYVPESLKGDEEVIMFEENATRKENEENKYFHHAEDLNAENEQEQNDRGEPSEPKKDVDFYLLALLLDETSKYEKREETLKIIEEEAKSKKVSQQEVIEHKAQVLGIIPKKIHSITIDKDGYLISFGLKDGAAEDKIYIGNDEDDIHADRKSEAEIKKIIAEKYDIKDKKLLKELDAGILKILNDNNNISTDKNLEKYNDDLCEIYINSVKYREEDLKLPTIEYDLKEAKDISEEEFFVRKNARKAPCEVAKVKGLTRNPIIRFYDFVNEKSNNFANWLDNVKTKFLPAPKEEEIIENTENNEGKDNKEESFRDSEYVKPRAVPTLKEQAEYAKSAGARAQENSKPVNLKGNTENEKG